MKDKLRQLLALILALSICFSLLSANVWATDEPEDVPTESTEVVTEKDKSEEKQEETPAETPSEDKQEEAPAETQNENKQEEAPAETQSENKQEETPAEAQSEDKQEETPAETQSENKQEETPAEAQSEKKQEETPAETQSENKQEETPAEAQSEKKQEEEASAQNEAETQPMKKKALGKMPGMSLTAYAATAYTSGQIKIANLANGDIIRGTCTIYQNSNRALEIYDTDGTTLLQQYDYGKAQTHSALGYDTIVTKTGVGSGGYDNRLVKLQKLSPSPTVTSVTLDKNELSLDAGGATAELIATVEANYDAIKGVTWSSSDSTVATVNSNGVITPVGAGDPVTIKATSTWDNTKYAECVVTVNAAQTPTETLLTTITPTGKTTHSATVDGVVTVSHNNDYYDGSFGWLWFDAVDTLTVSACEGYTITKCIFKQNAKSPVTDSSAPFELHFDSLTYGVQCRENSSFDGVTSIEVYGYATPTATHSVTITPGDNMTKTDASGATSQSDLSGAMTDVVYTADDGYYFPTDYGVATVNGISVTWDSYTQITVSGTPTADATITLTAPTAKTTPAAPTTAGAVDCTTSDNNDGKLTGVTTAMEYKKSDAESWTVGTGSDITGLVPGTYYVRLKATDTTNASANQELTIKGFISYTVTFKVVNGKWNEGEGDAATADKTVTLTGHDGDTLKLTADQIPAVGSKPNDTYKVGNWDTTPSTDTAITEATTYTYTYVAKEASVVTKAPEPKTLTYTGSAQALVTAGTAEGGTMMYAARIGDTYPSADEYSENIPTLTNANDHRYVWYYVKGDANHLDSEAQCVFVEIAKASITPSVSIENWTYGEAAKTPSVTGNTGNGTVTYTYAKQGETTFTDKVPTDAGSYTVKATVAETANYNSGTNTADFTINQASITITADDKSTKYGENIAELTYSVSGAYKTGDDLGVTLNTEATKTSPVNVYDITVNWNQNPNYTAVLAGGKYTITKDGATISASAFSGAYDGKTHGITVEETKHNIFDLLKPEAKVYYSTEELTVENFKEKGSTENITYTNVGEYTVYYFVESGNYDVQPISGSKTVSITKAPLTVTAKDKTIAYGEAPANDSVQYDGFAKGEDESVLTGELSYAYNYKQGDNSGEYTITPSGLTSDNYEIAFVDGKLTVKALGDPTLEVTTEGEDKRLDIVLDQESAEKLLTKDELKDYNNGVSATVYVLVDELSASDVPAADKKLAEAFMKDGKIGQYLDLTLWVKVGNRDARQITNAASDITLKIAIPEKLQSKDAERTFYLIRVHDGKAESLASTTGDTLEADSGLFSTYAIGYKDTEVKDDTKKDDTKKDDTEKDTTTKTKTNTSKTDTTKKSSGRSPKTGDAAMLGVWFSLAGASATGLGALTLGGKKRNRRIKRNYTGRRLNK